MYIINIQYNIIRDIAREGNIGNCHPEKTKWMSIEAKPRLTFVFEGWPYRAINIYIIYIFCLQFVALIHKSWFNQIGDIYLFRLNGKKSLLCLNEIKYTENEEFSTICVSKIKPFVIYYTLYYKTLYGIFIVLSDEQG